MQPNCLVPGRLIEFSFDSFVEFGREKLQSHDSGAPDDFLRHAGDHIVSQLRERGRDRFHAASNAESPSDSLALMARPRLFDSLSLWKSAGSAAVALPPNGRASHGGWRAGLSGLRLRGLDCDFNPTTFRVSEFLADKFILLGALGDRTH